MVANTSGTWKCKDRNCAVLSESSEVHDEITKTESIAPPTYKLDKKKSDSYLHAHPRDA